MQNIIISIHWLWNPIFCIILLGKTHSTRSYPSLYIRQLLRSNIDTLGWKWPIVNFGCGTCHFLGTRWCTNALCIQLFDSNFLNGCTSHAPPNLFHPSPDVLHAALATEMTVNLWLHAAAARHGTRQYGGQSRDTMPLPPLSVAFSAAPGAQRGGTRHASRIVLDAAAHYPASRLFQRPQVFDVMFGQL